jgi:hypothetical protein
MSERECGDACDSMRYIGREIRSRSDETGPHPQCRGSINKSHLSLINHVRLGRIDTRWSKQAAEPIRCSKGRQEDKADS